MEHGLPGELRLRFHPLLAGTGSTGDLLFPKGPPTQVGVTHATISKNSIAILTHRLAQINHSRWCRP